MPDDVRTFLSQGAAAGARYRLAAPRSAPQGVVGSQLARTAGESLEFMEHRDYQPGDDLRRMNWSAYARTDRLVVKVFRQDVCPHLDLLIDGSRSMALAGTEKLRATVGVAAALATAADNSGYSRRAYVTGPGCQLIRNGSAGAQSWEGLDFSAVSSPAEALRTLPPTWRPRGIRALVSDFLWLGDPGEVINRLADGAAAVLLIQILAAEDSQPATLGNHRLVDCESGETCEVFVDAAGQERYRQNLARHLHDWRLAARRAGATFVTLIAEQVCAAWDLSALVEAGALAA